MLYYLFVTLYVLVCLLLMVVILLQQGKGGDIANAFGGGSSQAVFGARAGATLLTKVTTGLAAAFMFLALMLAVWGPRGTSSVVGGVEGPARRQLPAAATESRLPAPAADALRRRRPRPPRRQPSPRPAPRRRRRRRSRGAAAGEEAVALPDPRLGCRRRAQLNSEAAPVAVFSPRNAEVAELADAPA